MTTIESITESVWREFGDRKNEGRIDFVVDVHSGNFYAVPKNVEHKDFTPELSCGKQGFVPVQLRVQKENRYALCRILIGASSHEANSNVVHNNPDLVKALNLTWELILKSPLINPVTVYEQKLYRKRPAQRKIRAEV